MLNAKSSENFPVPTKIGQMLAVWGAGGQGFQKVAIFTPKGTSLHEPILRQNLSRGVTSRLVGEKVRKSQTPIGKTCRR